MMSNPVFFDIMDLGVKENNLGSGPADQSPVSPNDTPAVPQSVSLTPDLKDQLGLTDCKPGDNYTIKLQAGDTSGEDGTQSFDVISSTPDTDDSGNDADADADSDAETKILGYKRPKIKPPTETPSTGAQHLLD